MDNIKQTITKNSVVYLYLFPELTDEDVEMLKAYGLKFAGKNHGATGDEDNWVVTGSKTALERYAEKWLGYELHPDYLYQYDDFAGEIINEACKVEEDIEQFEIENDDSVEGIVTFDKKICESFEDVTLEEVLEWLSEHDTAYEDVQMYFNTKDLEELDKEEIISWIADHNQLYDDFKLFFKDKLTLDEAIGRPSQATLDDCLEYYKNNAFGYNGVEDYVDTEFPMHSQEFKAEVVNYIKERKNESLSECKSIKEDKSVVDFVGEIEANKNNPEKCDAIYREAEKTLGKYDMNYVTDVYSKHRNVESKSIKEDADNWSFDKAIDWLTDIAMDQYLYSTRDDNAFWSAVGLALDHETLPAVLKTPGARKKIMQIAPRMVASKYYAKIHRFDRPHKNESKSIKESRPDKDIKTTTNKVTIKYGNSVKEVETCKPIKVTKKQLDSYKDNYSIVDVLEESKSIKESTKVIKCRDCKTEFTSNDELDKAMYKGVPYYICSVCETPIKRIPKSELDPNNEIEYVIYESKSIKEGIHRIYVNGELKDEIESSNPIHEVDPIAYKYKKLNGVKEVRVNYADGTTNTMQVESVNEDIGADDEVIDIK